MNRKQIAILSVLAVSALTASTFAVIRVKERMDVLRKYESTIDEIFRDALSKPNLGEWWMFGRGSKIARFAKELPTEKDRNEFVELCVRRILNISFDYPLVRNSQGGLVRDRVGNITQFLWGLYDFGFALRELNIDHDIQFEIIMRWVEKSRTEYMAVLDMPYDTKNYKAWHDKVNAVAGVRSEHPSLILSVQRNLFHRYLPNVKGDDRLKYQKTMDEYCEKIMADKKVIEDCLEQLRRKTPEVRILKFNNNMSRQYDMNREGHDNKGGLQ